MAGILAVPPQVRHAFDMNAQRTIGAAHVDVLTVRNDPPVPIE